MILKKTDLAEIRNANMRIVKNKDGESTKSDIGRASRVMIQLRVLDMKEDANTGGGISHRPGRKRHDHEDVDPIVDTFSHLKIVG